MAFNQYAKTERDFTTLLNSANMKETDRDKLSAVLASLVGFQATQPGTNESIEGQITDIETQIGDIVAAINNIKVPVWKMQVFDANGTFTVPDSIAGSVVYVTGSGGGGSGAAWITNVQNNGVNGACSGCYIEKQPLPVAAGDSIPVVIGAGGAAVSTNAITANPVNGNAGQQSSFGSLVIAGGGGGGVFPSDPVGGWIGSYLVSPGIYAPAENSVRYKAGNKSITATAFALGSAGGAFGNAGNSASGAGVTAQSAAANTGAGGGGVAQYTVAAPASAITSGAGGSGKIIVEWMEFV